MQSERDAIVLVSGGLDSAVCLGVARRDGYRVHALSFDYGQRHAVELECARWQARAFGAARHVTVPLHLAEFGGSALTGDGDVPKGGPDEAIGDGIPVTYVPARNTVFLSVALAWAEVVRARAIFIGVNAVDYSGYPDCRPEFIEAFEGLARLATKGGVEGTWELSIRTPLIELTKGDIIRLGLEVGVNFGHTWSCYDPQPGPRPCGGCESCRLRARGFADAGVQDPLT